MKSYHVIYKTTNTVNNKTYIGLHSTTNLDDGYIGSGHILKYAIRKYGKEAFTREVLHLCEDRDEARAKEKSLVTTEFCQRKDTYNLREGGGGAGEQTGCNNHMFGKLALNAKRVRAEHRDGYFIEALSIKDLSEVIGIDRANIRNLITKGIFGKRGYAIALVEDIV